MSGEIEDLGRRCLPRYADLSVSEDIQTLVRQVIEHYGRIDILINNARAVIGRDKVPITDLEEGP